MRRALIVAIDGPAGAGKSSIAKALASRLDYQLVDTGALYRTVAYAAIQRGFNLETDKSLIADLAAELAQSRAIALTTNSDGSAGVTLFGKDVSNQIRTPEVALAASVISAQVGVRSALLSLQRQAGERGGVVLEGRDIGTVVFPDAHVKFFLTASAEERARRRYEELLEKGSDASFADTLRDVKERDERDMRREVAPLRQAEDARLVDSTGKSLQEVINEMMQVIEARASLAPAAP